MPFAILVNIRRPLAQSFFYSVDCILHSCSRPTHSNCSRSPIARRCLNFNVASSFPTKLRDGGAVTAYDGASQMVRALQSLNYDSIRTFLAGHVVQRRR
jgi:hypothetical protein